MMTTDAGAIAILSLLEYQTAKFESKDKISITPFDGFTVRSLDGGLSLQPTTLHPMQNYYFLSSYTNIHSKAHFSVGQKNFCRRLNVFF